MYLPSDRATRVPSFLVVSPELALFIASSIPISLQPLLLSISSHLPLVPKLFTTSRDRPTTLVPSSLAFRRGKKSMGLIEPARRSNEGEG